MTMPVFISGVHINDNGELEINADEAAAAGVRSIELIEVKETKSHSVMQCYKADARIAELEARLAETEETKQMLCDTNEELGQQLLAAEARAEAAEKNFKDEREHAEWLQGECNKAVDDMEEANSRAEKAEADAGRLRATMQEVCAHLEHDAGVNGSKWSKTPYAEIALSDKPDALWRRMRDALSPAATAEQQGSEVGE